MLVTTWILFVVFGLIGLGFLNKLFTSRIYKAELLLMIFSIIIAAISAGVIFGGLKLF